MTVEFERTNLYGVPNGNPQKLEPNNIYTICERSLLKPKIELIVHSNPTGQKKDDAVTVRMVFGSGIPGEIILQGDCEINRYSQKRKYRAKDGFLIRSI